MFSDVLLTVDFDRTLTDTKTVIPERNIEAIRYFIENGGTFTVNTGRSVNTLGRFSKIIPVNAPFLLYNGSASYENGELTHCRTIAVPMWEMAEAIAESFPELNVEIQAKDTHYHIHQKQSYVEFCTAQGWNFAPAKKGMDLGPFIKLAVFGEVHDTTLDRMFYGSREELERFSQLRQFITERWGEYVEVFMASPRILDVHAKGVSKIRAARELQQRLGKKILVCVGDAANDIPMLDGADYAYCPADGVVADRYENVCSCGEGAVADVIYKKIPEILQNQP